MLNIAIDGPSGAGKSTVAKRLAKELNIMYLDTGAMYRAVALKVLKSGYSISDREAVLKCMDELKLNIQYSDGVQKMFVDGEDVTTMIREHQISQAASDVSKYPEVRIKLVNMQREIASKNDVVLDGRDITSFVLPKADYKFFLTASIDERARRRYEELKAKGQDVEYDNIYNDIKVRDQNDTQRDFAPLIKTLDSVYIDSTDYTIDQVVEIMKANMEKKK